tara:strand:+ start:531 stop:1382 length:852 start_codon:yes stop_codon:yes gene_type:complete
MAGLILGLTSLGVGLATTAASFGQAGAQKRKRDAATLAAEKAFKDARKRLDVNYMEDLGINKGIYDIARDRSMVSAAGQLQAAREGSARGIGSTAGQVYQQDLFGQREVRAAQEERQFNLDKAIAGEDARLAGLQADLSLNEAEGAQRAAAEAENARRQAIGEGIEGAISTVGQAASMVPLYSKGTAAKRKTAMASIEGKEGVADFNRKEFLQYERSMDPSMLRQARADDNYVNTLQSSKFGSNLQSAPFIFNMGGVNAAGGNEASAEYQQFLMFKKMMGENN